mmetsp:Transcript_25335/g.30673  ORF Transcript_25335/g.30673 Transcript_25335/m.30673 type:complete len:374 (-) Transcript_25335:80-1201(-)|eukprot:CAMPEP_0172498858 /NCGR_PEP_ID=MMETSP1066-20121228/118483_1 /TAXON_ID=671091 /ORGANISM="Coscinodiscus wailesii, Strain CCMP2513" /LENGTH=373 /DNA_ID=CAMNT_0013272307 /DNA_START=185 /DNA_END=1306 /DNA_ORIENTATION=+
MTRASLLNKVSVLSLYAQIASLFLFHVQSSPSPLPPTPPSLQLTDEQIKTFRRDGVLLVPNVLRGPELENAIKAAKKIARPRFIERIVHKVFPSYAKLDFQTWRKHDAMKHVAFDSVVPSLCAQVMGMDDSQREETRNKKSTPIRLLKDAFLAYKAGDKGCGWHVDDKGFWPCMDSPVGKIDAGVNVWITLSSVRASQGGGLAVAPGSFRARWRERVRSIISPSFMTTCALEQLSPESHERFERMKVLYDMEPGDAIIHDRYCFHHGEPFKNEKEGKKLGTKLRISLRYMPANAKFCPLDIDAKDAVIGAKKLAKGDPISAGGEYFPQVWPCALPEENVAVDFDEPMLSWSLLGRMAKVVFQKQMQKKQQDAQ